MKKLKYVIIVIVEMIVFSFTVAAYAQDKIDNKQYYISQLKKMDSEIKNNSSKISSMGTTIKHKNQQIRDIVGTLEVNRTDVKSQDEEKINDKIEVIDQDIKNSKDSIYDVTLQSYNFKLNLIKKNFDKAFKNLNNIVDIQNKRIDSLTKVDKDMDSFIEELKNVKGLK